jgi:hypothetical protein
MGTPDVAERCHGRPADASKSYFSSIPAAEYCRCGASALGLASDATGCRILRFSSFWEPNQTADSARLGLALVETHPIRALNEAENGGARSAPRRYRASPEGPGSGWSASVCRQGRRKGGAAILSIMRRPEPDLDVIRRLLSEAAWRRQGVDDVEARRLVAACALAWFAGASQCQLGRLRLCDWLPDGQKAVRLRLTDSPDVGVDAKIRVVPVLPVLMRAVEARLADIHEAGHESFILASREGVSARWFAENCGSAIATASEGKVKSLADLAERFQDYMRWGSGDDPLREWLASPTRIFIVPAGKERAPGLADLRRVLRAWHPAG